MFPYTVGYSIMLMYTYDSTYCTFMLFVDYMGTYCMPVRRTSPTRVADGVAATRRSLTTMSKPTFEYFNSAGRGLASRVSLFYAFGKDGWVDSRLSSFDEFKANKEAGKYPMGSVPVLTLADGTMVSQSTAIARWAAKQSTPRLYPDDPNKAIVVDFIMETFNEILGKTPAANPPELRKEYSENGPMFKGLTALEAIYSKCDGGYPTGALTIAELTGYMFVNMILTDDFTNVKPEYMDKFPSLKALHTSVPATDVMVGYHKEYSS